MTPPDLTEEELSIVLAMLDEENSRDQRYFKFGRTTQEVYNLQSVMYWNLRRKLVAALTDTKPPPEQPLPG